jgi:hypothetical protein
MRAISTTMAVLRALSRARPNPAGTPTRRPISVAEPVTMTLLRK